MAVLPHRKQARGQGTAHLESALPGRASLFMSPCPGAVALHAWQVCEYVDCLRKSAYPSPINFVCTQQQVVSCSKQQ